MEPKIVEKPTLEQLETMIWGSIENHIKRGKELVDHDWGLGIIFYPNEPAQFIQAIGDCRCALSCLIDVEKDTDLLKNINRCDYAGIADILPAKLGILEDEVNALVNGFDSNKNKIIPTIYEPYYVLGFKIRNKAIKAGYLTT